MNAGQRQVEHTGEVIMDSEVVVNVVLYDFEVGAFSWRL